MTGLRAKTDDPKLQGFVDFFNAGVDHSERVRLSHSYERADCGVRAVALVTGESYESAHGALAAEGRKRGRRSRMGAPERAVRRLGFECERWDVDGKTITTVERELPAKGAFLISVRGHICAHVDGTTYDWAAGSRKHIEYVVRVVQRG